MFGSRSVFPASLQNCILSLSMSNANESESFSWAFTGAAGQFDILA